MPSMNDFAKLMEDVTNFHGLLARMETELQSPKEKKLVAALLEQMKQTQVQAQEAFPKAISALKEGVAEVKGEIEATREKIAAVRADLERKRQAAARRPPKPQLPTPKPEALVDPALGGILAAELLQRFGKPDAKPRAVPADLGSVAEAWTDVGDQGHGSHESDKVPQARPVATTGDPSKTSLKGSVDGTDRRTTAAKPHDAPKRKPSKEEVVDKELWDELPE